MTRPAFRCMHVCLDLDGVTVPWNTEEIGQISILCAQGLVEDCDLADWLRDKARDWA